MQSNQNQNQTPLTNEQELYVLGRFNKPVGEKKYSKLDVLELEKPYNIIGWTSVKVKNRKSIVFDLQEFQVWAPDRFSKYTNEQLDSLVQHKLKLVYYGKKKLPNGFECHDIKIDE
uniref:Uncharacterized protein n=1 Tax=Cacopsylla melanoneura TaxID=428564 RepID=A0A8D8SZS8_9HEMI